MNEVIKKIIEFLEEAREKHNVPKEKLEKCGKVIYANGNDGTEFDWDVNERLCEFGYGTEKGDCWAFKLLIDTSGDAAIYCYPNGEMKPVETLKKKLADERSMKALYSLMLEKEREVGFNKTLEELGLA